MRVVRGRLIGGASASLDIGASLRAGLPHDVLSRLSGRRVAITAGSRGSVYLPEIIAKLCATLREIGAVPFVVACMGSHGGGTVRGQLEVLAACGVSTQTVYADVRASLKAVPMGRSLGGATPYMNSALASADAVVPIGQVALHPSGHVGLSSGLCKMLAVGAGGVTGARQAHAMGTWPVVREVGEWLAQNTSVALGVAFVEGGDGSLQRLDVVTPDRFLSTDMDLYEVAARSTDRLPDGAIDVLVVVEVGKDVSGTCMSPWVIGSERLYGDPAARKAIQQIVALRLTRQSCGNYLGLGQADFATYGLLRACRLWPTHLNLLTTTGATPSGTTEVHVPPAVPTERDAIETAMTMVRSKRPNVVVIESTARLREFWASEGLAAEWATNERVELESKALSFEMPFDRLGRLIWP
jgi:hypothetical protein